MNVNFKKLLKLIAFSPLNPIFKILYDFYNIVAFDILSVQWKLKGYKKPDKQQIEYVTENITFIYKSFERQYMARRLYKNIQAFFPGAKVIIADDSAKPLKLKGEHLEILQLPFNSGLSFGLNRALERVETPFTMRLDDDLLLTPFSKIYEQLIFLNEHSEIDLSAVQMCRSPNRIPPSKVAATFLKFKMSEARRKLIIPHKTKIDATHYVLGKTSNSFVIRTEKYKALGYDDNIRMIDHHEFFLRAAGRIVSAADIEAFVFHYHNPFDKHYKKYRSDYKADQIYIRKKHNL